MKLKAILLTAIMLGACANIPKDSGFSDLVELTAPMLPAPAEWVGETMTELEARDRVSALLSEPLTEASVAEITVLSNRDLRAVLYGLKAARGNFRDAASLPNPFVTALLVDEPGGLIEDCFGNQSIRDVPIGGSVGIGYNILDLLFFPQILKAAEANFNASKFGSIRQFADLTYIARLKFYEAMSARQALEMTEQSKSATAAAADTAQALYDAGNIPLLDLNREKLFDAQMRAELIAAQRRFDMAGRELVQAMGLPENLAQSVKLEGRLRTPDSAELAPLSVAQIMDRNLELKHREALIQTLGSQMGLKDVMSFVGDVEIEGEIERHDGRYEYSGGIGFEVPLFNFGGGKREANRARLEIMRQQYQGTVNELRTTADIAYGTLQSSREHVLLQRQDILPLSNKVLQGMQLEYNAMQIGVFDLLAAKRNQLAAGQSYIMALEDYWKTRAAYEYLLSGGTPSIDGAILGRASLSGHQSNGGAH